MGVAVLLQFFLFLIVIEEPFISGFRVFLGSDLKGSSEIDRGFEGFWVQRARVPYTPADIILLLVHVPPVAAVSDIKLTYFPIEGVAEAVRLTLLAGKKKTQNPSNPLSISLDPFKSDPK